MWETDDGIEDEIVMPQETLLLDKLGLVYIKTFPETTGKSIYALCGESLWP